MTTNENLLYGDSPLACAWLAASLEKKLSKQQYLKTSIVDSTRAIELSSAYNKDISSKIVSNNNSGSQFQFESQTQPQTQTQTNNNNDKTTKEPITLRISSQLLYGVVKIYSRKTKYLYDEVTLALVQLKSAFAVSKSITLPIEQTVISSLDNITLKDTITKQNILYDSETFDINQVFGNIEEESRRGTQLWTQNDSNNTTDYALGDISIGRNNENNTTEMSNMNDAFDYDIDVDYNVNNNEEDDVGNQSIDALARRAELPVDDLDGVDDDLELDLNLKETAPSGEINAEIPGITDYRLTAIDDMDLEFTIDETRNVESDNDNENNQNSTAVGNILEESDDEANNIARTEISRRRRRRRNPKTNSYDKDGVIRTQRKRIITDDTFQISTDQLKKNQKEYPTKLRKSQFTNHHDNEEQIYEAVIQKLQPSFLTMIGSTWNSIKRRRLQLDADDSRIEELPEFSEHNFTGTENIDIADDNDATGTIESNIPENNDILPNFENDDMLEPEFGVPEVDNGNEYDAIPHEIENQDNQSDKEAETELNENSDDDYDSYADPRNKNKATIEVAQELRTIFTEEKTETVKFEKLVETCNFSSNKKSSTTKAFFELLVLGTANTIKIEQERLFGEITITSKDDIFEKFL